MRTIKMGDHGSDVVTMQEELNEEGYGLVVDGQFGKASDTAVRDYQRKLGLVADGVCGPATWDKLLAHSTSGDAFDDCVDAYYPLIGGQFVDAAVKHIGITLHHTVSAGSPYKVVDVWNEDNRGAVGTHFLIGGKTLDGDDTHDGQIMQCVALGDFAYHMLTTRTGMSSKHNEDANRLYVGVEIVSYGCLTRGGDGLYRTMDGQNRVVPEDQVEVLAEDWRTYRYWHKYTTKQVDAIVELIVALDKKLGLNLGGSKYDSIDKLFDLSWDALAFRQKLTTHSSFEYGKFDAYPCKELIQKLKVVYPTL